MKTISKLAVIGAGPWGTAFACLLKKNGHDIKLWAYQNILDQNIKPFAGIEVTDNIANAVQHTDYIFLVLNSKFFIQTLDQLNFAGLRDKKFIVLTKGLVEHDRTHQLPFEVLIHRYRVPKKNIAVLSGPNIAAEIYKGIPAAAMVASSNNTFLDELKVILSSVDFRVEISNDLTGLQWCGILKNPVAIGAGICDGLYSDHSNNAKAEFMTLALEDMKNIGTYFGSDAKTFYTLAGIGDLITTCFAGRNRQVGMKLALGASLDEIYESFHPQRPEGPDQLKIISRLIDGKVQAPMFERLFKIIYEGEDPHSLFK